MKHRIVVLSIAHGPLNGPNMQDSIEMMSLVMMAELAISVETEKGKRLAPPPD